MPSEGPEVIGFYIREQPYGWMSNFERAPMLIDGVTYPTNEHFYQAQRAKDPAMRAWIASAPTAWAAMKAGRALRDHETTDNWPERKLEVMLAGLRAKFAQHPRLLDMLLATGDAVLHEASPTDSFWGNAPKADGSPGDSHLGRLLMQVRDEWRRGEDARRRMEATR